MPTSSEQSQHSPIDGSPHLASVSLPSSSGGLDALLNPPRTASHPTHLKDSMPYYKGGKRQGVTSSEHSSGFPNPYPRRASSPGTVTRHLRSPSPISSKRKEGPSAYPLTYMPLTRAGISNFTLPLSNVDPKKARIEAEKGRRVELRDKFANLRDAMPMDGQKVSKINILDRGEWKGFTAGVHELDDGDIRQLQAIDELRGAPGSLKCNPRYQLHHLGWIA
ncbi:hypothetical protein QFC19_007986 [Naganishia cerealis]|uniref:Uncharacterized protein n=1 Tax=Naganishia cerealis TaxID=610337 RepID=A0ACC2V5U4_9TREE|nr:hypothetical protein QFC19_007986 [Naganishia cerealis]